MVNSAWTKLEDKITVEKNNNNTHNESKYMKQNKVKQQAVKFVT